MFIAIKFRLTTASVSIYKLPLLPENGAVVPSINRPDESMRIRSAPSLPLVNVMVSFNLEAICRDASVAYLIPASNPSGPNSTLLFAPNARMFPETSNFSLGVVPIPTLPDESMRIRSVSLVAKRMFVLSTL